ncbi:hypothetical protein BRETT_001351 [Brettanomyces bruxellensis]|uniref:DNA damage checkpoint protein LCD1 n=1 Tax=Dekkera bruxellensis TaxID=5007 RepID=A0A871R8P4_DEKBR|nr:uncharacterized protein BRETT_001351 [Brettanomyces bruxellensis]QOU21626.1 hypothetical protein BRETT_001351 [Brettanomyces bruxellensis]
MTRPEGTNTSEGEDMEDDWFDDSDVDFDEVFSTAAEAKKVQTESKTTSQYSEGDKEDGGRTIIEDATVSPVSRREIDNAGKVLEGSNDNINKGTKPDENENSADGNEDILTLKGENSILRAKLEQITKKQEEEQKQLTDRLRARMKEKESKIEALNDNIVKIKEENEFLMSENKTLTGKYIMGKNKRRKFGNPGSEAGLSQYKRGVTNYTSSETATPSQNRYEMSEKAAGESQNVQKVAILNQATVFQDEKMLFIESMVTNTIPGMEKTILDYLSKISSSFGYCHKGFEVGRPGESIKTAIINYLISFESRNRIDLLISSFVEILLDYIMCSLNKENGNSKESHTAGGKSMPWSQDDRMLPIPYLLALVYFSLNYRPRAVSSQLIGDATTTICRILDMYPQILKQETFYLLPDEKEKFSGGKTMHAKILELFTVIFSMDILESLSKLAAFSDGMEGPKDTIIEGDSSQVQGALSLFWSITPQELIIYSLLSSKTPAIFVHDAVEMLISSITEESFGFENVTIKVSPSIHSRRLLTPEETTQQILSNAIILLDQSELDPEISIAVCGLSRTIGDNSSIKLLDILSPTQGLAPNPVTHSMETYEKILALSKDSQNIAESTLLLLKVKLKILQMFELYLSYEHEGSIRPDIVVNLIVACVSILGKQQECILRSPRATNVELSNRLIEINVRLIHFLVTSPDYAKTIQKLPQLTLREMVIALLRISADSLKGASIDFVTKLRMKDKFRFHIFNENLETKLMDRFGILEDVGNRQDDEFYTERAQIEVGDSNGLELNYTDETIDLARDILGQCLTCDEADMLHYSINYVSTPPASDEDEDIEMT